MHQDILNKIKSRFFMLLFVSVIIIVGGLISMFFIEDKVVCVCVSIIGLFILYVAFSKYGRKTEENTYILVADCVNRSRSGYRRQYFEYIFKTEDGKSFEIKTAQKEKFKVNLKYIMCFKKTNNEESQVINATDLIYAELQ